MTHTTPLTGFESLLVPIANFDTVLKAAVNSVPSDPLKLDLLYLRFHEDRPKVNELAEILFQELINYAIPKQKLNEQLARDSKAGVSVSTSWMRLCSEAKRLFIKYNSNSKAKNANIRYGEVGEVLAYCVAIHFLSAGQIAAKMALKTNSEMPVFGLDGIHAMVDKNGELWVYFLESKMTRTASAGAKQYADSAAKFEEDRAHKLNEYRIVRDLSNLDSIEGAAREQAIEYFDPYSKSSSTVRERFVGIIAHTENLYQNKIDVDDTAPIDIHETTFISNYSLFHKKRVDELNKYLIKSGATVSKARAIFVAIPNVDKFKELFAKEMSGE